MTHAYKRSEKHAHPILRLGNGEVGVPTKLTRTKFTPEDDAMIVDMKSRGLAWTEMSRMMFRKTGVYRPASSIMMHYRKFIAKEES